MSIAEKLQTIVDNEQRVFDAGKKSEYDRFWDNYQEYGNRTFYFGAFSGWGWADETFAPKYPIICKASGSVTYMFGQSNITDIYVPIIVDYSVGSLTTMFINASKLKTIRELNIVETLRFSNTFDNCHTLENITITGIIGQNGLNFQWSTKLSKASIENIISCLSTTTSGLTVTLSKTAVDAAFTETEWETLIATKPNWTISLV